MRRRAARLLLSRAASSAPGIPVSERTEARLRGRWSALDANAEAMLSQLSASEAPLVWHKHGTFFEHLRDVWLMLCAWEQPQATCRLGLFHSAYSNSFVAMGIFDREKDRGKLAELIGDEAENLVYKFCTIDRQSLERTVLEEGTIRPDGYDMTHIATGTPLRLTGGEAAAMITETLADEAEQRFGWQSELEDGRVRAVWPGPFAPTLRLSRTSRLAYALRASQLVPEHALPPPFERCAKVLAPSDEAAAREAYMRAVCAPAHVDGSGGPAGLADLDVAARLNPYVGEPHLVAAQLLLEAARWDEAAAKAAHGVALLETLATSWDKRMSWQAWLNWGRCLAFQAQLREWPATHGGIESLGAVVPRQRARGLNVGRSLL